MIKKTLTGLSIFLATLPSLATTNTELPHNFTAGTPARASEVNENFEYLSNIGKSLHNRISNLENTLNTSEINYSAKTTVIGQKITINDTEYTITEYPIYDPLTKKSHLLRLPVETPSRNVLSGYSHTDTAAQNFYKITIHDGHQILHKKDCRYFTTARMGEDVMSHYNSVSCNSNIEIKVGSLRFVPSGIMSSGTNFDFNFESGRSKTDSQLQDALNMEQHNNIVDEWIDYIQITEITPND